MRLKKVVGVTVGLLMVCGAAFAQVGQLKVTSFPTGAQVLIDGVNTGKVTPMSAPLPVGEHAVTVAIPNSGWNADTRTVTIVAGNNDLSVTLLPTLTVGPPGPQGPKGDKGDPGVPGQSASIAVGTGLVGESSGSQTSVRLDTGFTDGLYARLFGSNAFTGDQSVSGQVTATRFAGDGSGLFNLNLDSHPQITNLAARVQVLEDKVAAIEPPPLPSASLWARQLGDNRFADDPWRGGGVAGDRHGNVIVAGVFSQTADLGGTPLTSPHNYDLFVAKLGPDGRHVWSKAFSQLSDAYLTDVGLDREGNVYVTGYWGLGLDLGGGSLPYNPGGYNMFVAKFDPAGSHVWSKSFGIDLVPFKMAVNAVGEVVIAGVVGPDPVDFGGGPLAPSGVKIDRYSPEDIFVAKLASDGSHLWSKRFGHGLTGRNLLFAVAVDGANNIGVLGIAGGAIDLGGGPLPLGPFIAKFSSGGIFQWSMADPFGPADLGADSLGNLFVMGSRTLRKFSPSGALLWQKNLPSQGNAQFSAQAIAVDEGGDVVVTGSFRDSLDLGGSVVAGAGGDDIFVAKYRGTTGEHLWSKGFGGLYSDVGYRVGLDGLGDVCVTGFFASTVDFDGRLIAAGGYRDIFIAKLKR